MVNLAEGEGSREHHTHINKRNADPKADQKSPSNRRSNRQLNQEHDQSKRYKIPNYYLQQ